MNVRFGSEIAAAAAAHHLDPRLLAAVAAQETGGPASDSGANIVGDGGHGHGLFQIDDRAWSFARTPAAMDPAKNAQVAAGILGDDLRRFGGNVHAALSAYNSGSPTATGSTTRWPDGAVLGYADSVLRHYSALGGAPEELAADARAGMATADPLQAAAGGARALAANAPATAAPSSLAAGAGVPARGPSQALLAQMASSMPPPASTPTPPSPSWNSLTAASSNETAEADRSLADLVDSADVFGSDPSDSA